MRTKYRSFVFRTEGTLHRMTRYTDAGPAAETLLVVMIDAGHQTERP